MGLHPQSPVLARQRPESGTLLLKRMFECNCLLRYASTHGHVIIKQDSWCFTGAVAVPMRQAFT